MACMQLICDTLLLVPPQYDVTRALNTIQESLRINSPGR